MPNRSAVGERLPATRSPARWAAASSLVFVLALTACGTEPGTPSPLASGLPDASGGPTASGQPATPTAEPTPAPTIQPTPQFTNAPDAALADLIPREVAGATIEVPPVDEFGMTPGDIGLAYGELGLRFEALQLAYSTSPRLSLFAVRVGGQPVTTDELEPHLETAGRYVGINGLVREPWQLTEIDGRVAWVRPEDNATAAGTMIYTWAAGEYVFLMIGVDDTVNRAVFAGLPGEAAPTPTPRPSRSPAASGSAAPTEAPSATP